MLLLAIEAHHQYAFQNKKDSSKRISLTVKDLHDKIYSSRSSLPTKEEQYLFVNYLDVYFGLKAKYIEYSPARYDLYSE